MISPVTKNKILIDRQDSIQIETNLETGIVTKSKIEWKNPCEYRMISISTNKRVKDGVDSFFSITPITIAIVSTAKDFYIFETKVDSANKHLKYSDTVRIVQ